MVELHKMDSDFSTQTDRTKHVIELMKATSVLASQVIVGDAEKLLQDWERETAGFGSQVWWQHDFLAAFLEYRRKLDRLERESC